MEDIKRMVSRTGFIEVFWERIAKDLQNGLISSRRETYESMEEEYENEYGCYQFPSFDAFKKYVSRNYNKDCSR